MIYQGRKVLDGTLLPGTDSQKILEQVIAKTRITRFERTSPSLEDIFIRIARPEKNHSHE